jgi:hypothetical protein
MAWTFSAKVINRMFKDSARSVVKFQPRSQTKGPSDDRVELGVACISTGEATVKLSKLLSEKVSSASVG